MTLRVTTLTRVDELADATGAWDALVDRAGGPLFSRPFWCRPWCRHLPGGEPHVVLVHDGDDLVGVAPLSRQRIGPVDLVRFLGHGLGTVSALVHEPGRTDVHDALWRATLGGSRRFAQLLELRPPDDGPPVPAAIRADVQPRDTCLVVRCDQPFDAYLRGRPKKLRENLRRAERALARAGHEHRIDLVTTEAGWRSSRAGVVEVFDRAEAAQPRHHMFQGPLADFMDDFLTEAAAEGRLRLFVGHVDGEPASFGIAFAGGGTLSYWITRFDPAYADASIGILLLAHIVEQGFGDDFDTVDLLLGDQGHKRRWATDEYPTLTVHAATNAAILAAGSTALRAADLRRRR